MLVAEHVEQAFHRADGERTSRPIAAMNMMSYPATKCGPNSQSSGLPSASRTKVAARDGQNVHLIAWVT